MVEKARRLLSAQCPHCLEQIEVEADISLTGVRLMNDAKPKHQIEEEQAQLAVDAASAGGVLEAFRKTVNDIHRRKQQNPPKAIAKHLMHFLQTARPELVPKPLFEELRSEASGIVTVIQSSGIAAALDDGKIFHFFAWDRAKDMKGFGGLAAQEWIRGRHGYVPKDSRVFSAALAERSTGAFDTAGRL